MEEGEVERLEEPEVADGHNSAAPCMKSQQL